MFEEFSKVVLRDYCKCSFNVLCRRSGAITSLIHLVILFSGKVQLATCFPEGLGWKENRLYVSCNCNYSDSSGG